jgi:mono/diheme cytochrome c family protein
MASAQFFHAQGHWCELLTPTVTSEFPPAQSDNAVSTELSGERRSLIAALVVAAAIACIALVLLVLPATNRDPYTRQTLDLQGSAENGGKLFLINCAGCHGIAGQGLVGPNLHAVANRKNQRQLIQQVVSGKTPPMPRFQPEPQAMADLLAYLNSLV